MKNRVRFLSVEDVLLIHEDTIAHEGGGAGLRDPALLESAVMIPQQSYQGAFLHKDLASMAAAYLFHLARNHPFVDGNKRAAALSALVFLDSNGVIRLPEPHLMEQAVIAVAGGSMSKQQLTRWMRIQLRKK